MNDSIPQDKAAQEPQATVRIHLERLREETDADFVAMSLYDPEQREIRWRVAYGALSERYKAIAIRMGKGIAGEVLMTGRPFTVIVFPDDVPSEPLEYPIMIIERLVSCFAAPIGSGSSVFGALMVGDRKGRVFSPGEKDTVQRTANRIGKLYAPSYESAEISRERPAPGKSPLMLYLQRNMVRPALLSGAEILDQRITRIPEPLQLEITRWLDRLLVLLGEARGESMRVSVERKEGCWMTLEASAPGRLEEPQEQLSWLIGRVGELQGNVEMYNEPGLFRLRINLPVGMMAEDTPWVF